MNRRFIVSALLVCGCFSGAALAETYVCQLSNKQRIYQNTPCSGGSQTLSSVGDSSSSSRTGSGQDEYAANARRELERQNRWMDQQQAIRSQEENTRQRQIDTLLKQEAAAEQEARQEQLRRQEIARQEDQRRIEAANQDRILREIQDLKNQQSGPRTCVGSRGVYNCY